MKEKSNASALPFPIPVSASAPRRIRLYSQTRPHQLPDANASAARRIRTRDGIRHQALGKYWQALGEPHQEGLPAIFPASCQNGVLPAFFRTPVVKRMGRILCCRMLI